MKIKEVQLYSNSIQQQKQFYQDVLGFELLVDTAKFISFKTGSSTLSFLYRKKVKPSHVAFNIPPYSEEKALKWLQERVGILDFEGQLISDFHSWNAKAIYFYDADNNIMEFIARRNLNIETESDFMASSVVSISEMAIASNSIETIYKTINGIKPISIFSGDFSRFCALGNDEGLFILIDKNAKKWYPTKEKVYTSDFVIKGDYNFAFENGEIKGIIVN